MAKLATINREKKREGLVAKYAKKRAALEAIISDSNRWSKTSRHQSQEGYRELQDS